MIGSIQSLYAQIQTDLAAGNPAQKVRQPEPNTIAQDTVTISNSARQAQAGSNQPASSAGDVDHDGDSH